jgi:hypothetical protein
LIVVNDNLDKSIKTIWKYINNNEVKIWKFILQGQWVA